MYQKIQTSILIIKQHGIVAFCKQLYHWLYRKWYHTDKYNYYNWITLFEPPAIAEAKSKAVILAYTPLISIITPIYNPPADVLRQMIQSVQAQAYPHWELCLCDDGSTDNHIHPMLALMARIDSRIKVCYLPTNSGISTASNHALALATGEFVAFLDHDDELAPHALYEVAKLLNQQPQADFIYSDEDKITVDGQRYDPFFKPDWSPDLLLSMNYLAHLSVIRTTLVREVGGFRQGYEGSQDYDLFLRVIERTDQIYHIPQILYHWRAVPTSVAFDTQVKDYAVETAQQALTDHLTRQQIPATILPGNRLGRWRVKYHIKDEPTVTIIIPCNTNYEGLEALTQEIIEHSTYRQFEFLIIDNSTGTAVEQRVQQLAKRYPQTIYFDQRDQPFNFSRLHNKAVDLSSAPLLLFLNDDVMPIEPDWLESLVEHAQRPEVGAVGALLLYPDRTIQHGGVIMGTFGYAGHAFRALPSDSYIYFDLPQVIRNCSAVTGACLMTRREIFDEVGGFDESHFPVAFQDVDLCLKVGSQGYRVIYTPHAKLFHAEAKTKAITKVEEDRPHPYECRHLQRKWAEVIAHDPFYNPNLARQSEVFTFDLVYYYLKPLELNRDLGL